MFDHRETMWKHLRHDSPLGGLLGPPAAILGLHLCFFVTMLMMTANTTPNISENVVLMLHKTNHCHNNCFEIRINTSPRRLGVHLQHQRHIHQHHRCFNTCTYCASFASCANCTNCTNCANCANCTNRKHTTSARVITGIAGPWCG